MIYRRQEFQRNSFQTINSSDIDEIKNLIDYVSGLVIFNEDLFEAYETKITASNSNIYMKAVLKQDDNSDKRRKIIISLYREENKYVKEICNKYNVEPYKVRICHDYDIVLASNKTLNIFQEENFRKAYLDSLTYYMNVTRTKAFRGQTFEREFIEELLLFMSIQKYISISMNTQFNPDNFNKYQLKNYFISNGVDYFDKLPLTYQRKLVKLLNDLMRNKGTDNIFGLIKQIFSMDNISICRYVLARFGQGENANLKFFKVPYEEEFDPLNNEICSFESITGNDPYWRSDETKILEAGNFNYLNTKYISVECTMNILQNSYGLSYLFYMLNDLESYNQENNISSLYFNDSSISDSKINLYDAMMGLAAISMKYASLDDTLNIESGFNVDNIYGYSSYYGNENYQPIKEKLNEIKEYISDNNVNDVELKTLIDSFIIKSYNENSDYTIDSLNAMYKSSPVYYTEINNLCDLIENMNIDIIKSSFDSSKLFEKSLRSYIQNGETENALEYIASLFFSYSLELKYLSTLPNLKDLLKRYLSNKITDNSLRVNTFNVNQDVIYLNNKYDVFYTFLISGDMENIYYDELCKYIESLYGSETNTNELYKTFKNNPNSQEGLDSLFKFIDSKDDFFTSPVYLRYRNISTFFDVFSLFDSEINNSSNVTNFMENYEYNENTRRNLEKIIVSTNDKILYDLLNDLWQLCYKSSLDTSLYSGYSSFTDYIMNKNKGLYEYISNFETNEDNVNEYDIMEERIMYLCEVIESFIKSNTGIILNSTLNSLFSELKYYVMTLIEVFKAYTLDLINANSKVSIDDPYSNHIKLFDEIEFNNFVFYVNDYLQLEEMFMEDSLKIQFKNLYGIYNLVTSNIPNIPNEILELVSPTVEIYNVTNGQRNLEHTMQIDGNKMALYNFKENNSYEIDCIYPLAVEYEGNSYDLSESLFDIFNFSLTKGIKIWGTVNDISKVITVTPTGLIDDSVSHASILDDITENEDNYLVVSTLFNIPDGYYNNAHLIVLESALNTDTTIFTITTTDRTLNNESGFTYQDIKNSGVLSDEQLDSEDTFYGPIYETFMFDGTEVPNPYYKAYTTNPESVYDNAIIPTYEPLNGNNVYKLINNEWTTYAENINNFEGIFPVESNVNKVLFVSNNIVTIPAGSILKTNIGTFKTLIPKGSSYKLSIKVYDATNFTNPANLVNGNAILNINDATCTAIKRTYEDETNVNGTNVTFDLGTITNEFEGKLAIVIELNQSLYSDMYSKIDYFSGLSIKETDESKIYNQTITEKTQFDSSNKYYMPLKVLYTIKESEDNGTTWNTILNETEEELAHDINEPFNPVSVIFSSDNLYRIQGKIICPFALTQNYRTLDKSRQYLNFELSADGNHVTINNPDEISIERTDFYSKFYNTNEIEFSFDDAPSSSLNLRISGNVIFDFLLTLDLSETSNDNLDLVLRNFIDRYSSAEFFLLIDTGEELKYIHPARLNKISYSSHGIKNIKMIFPLDITNTENNTFLHGTSYDTINSKSFKIFSENDMWRNVILDKYGDFQIPEDVQPGDEVTFYYAGETFGFTFTEAKEDNMYNLNWQTNPNSNWSNLSKLFLPSNVITIRDSAFENLTNLNEIGPFSPSLKSLNHRCFADVTSERENDNQLKLVFLNNKVDNEYFKYKMTSPNITELRLLINSSFIQRNNLDSIVFPRNLFYLYNTAFTECRNLNSVDFKRSLNLTYIGRSCFLSCYELSDVIFQEEVNVPIILDTRAFSSCHSLVHLKGTTIGFINAKAFAFCNNLETVDLPNIERIGMATTDIIFVSDTPTSPLTDEARIEALENGFNPVRDFTEGCTDNFDINKVFQSCPSLKEINLGPNLYYISPFTFLESGNRYSKIYRYDENTSLINKQCEIVYIYDEVLTRKKYLIPKNDFVYNDAHKFTSFYLNGNLITPIDKRNFENSCLDNKFHTKINFDGNSSDFKSDDIFKMINWNTISKKDGLLMRDVLTEYSHTLPIGNEYPLQMYFEDSTFKIITSTDDPEFISSEMSIDSDLNIEGYIDENNKETGRYQFYLNDVDTLTNDRHWMYFSSKSNLPDERHKIKFFNGDEVARKGIDYILYNKYNLGTDPGNVLVYNEQKDCYNYSVLESITPETTFDELPSDFKNYLKYEFAEGYNTNPDSIINSYQVLNNNYGTDADLISGPKVYVENELYNYIRKYRIDEVRDPYTFVSWVSNHGGIKDKDNKKFGGEYYNDSSYEAYIRCCCDLKIPIIDFVSNMNVYPTIILDKIQCNDGLLIENSIDKNCSILLRLSTELESLYFNDSKLYYHTGLTDFNTFTSEINRPIEPSDLSDTTIFKTVNMSYSSIITQIVNGEDKYLGYHLKDLIYSYVSNEIIPDEKQFYFIRNDTEVLCIFYIEKKLILDENNKVIDYDFEIHYNMNEYDNGFNFVSSPDGSFIIS